MILLRHGESEFNVRFTRNKRDPGIVDPRLTPLGEHQAAAAAAALAGRGITRIITSPYTRALQTARIVAQRIDVPITINPLVRERYAFTCDVGTPRTELAMAWPDHDFAGMDEIWWPVMEEPGEHVIGRAALFRAEMTALSDWHRTLVISHWGFILALTGRRVGNGDILRCDPTDAAPEAVVWRH